MSVFVGSTLITILYCKSRIGVFNVDWTIFWYAYTFTCKCILLQRCCLFCYKIKLTIDVFFLYCNCTFMYNFFLNFHLSQPMSVYPFEHTKELKQFIDMYTTSSKDSLIQFETFHSIEILRVSEYLTLSWKSSHQWVFLNDRYSTV